MTGADRAYAMAGCDAEKQAECDRVRRRCRHCPPMPKEGLKDWLIQTGFYRGHQKIPKGPPQRNLEAAFSANVEKQADGCWLWKGTLHSGGMPGLETGTGKIYAHRWAYRRYVDPTLASSARTVRSCGNKLCVNPQHVKIIRRKNAQSA